MKTMRNIAVAVLILSATTYSFSQNGTGDRHNGEYIVPSAKDSSGGSLSTGDRTTTGAMPEERIANPGAGNRSSTNGSGSNNESTEPATTSTTNTETNTEAHNCDSCGGKWGLLGLLGLVGLVGLRKKNS